MTTTIEISENRLAKISVRVTIDKQAIHLFAATKGKEHEGEDFYEWAEKVFINGEPFFRVLINEVVIYSTSYSPSATTLTGQDWKLISNAAKTLEESVKLQPYTLLEYYD
jgi:hypothetical protein